MKLLIAIKFACEMSGNAVPRNGGRCSTGRPAVLQAARRGRERVFVDR